jgi:hypothetical protein
MPQIAQHVEKGSNVRTDSLPSYIAVASDYTHHVIDHAEKYVEGQVHTTASRTSGAS